MKKTLSTVLAVGRLLVNTLVHDVRVKVPAEFWLIALALAYMVSSYYLGLI